MKIFSATSLILASKSEGRLISFLPLETLFHAPVTLMVTLHTATAIFQCAAGFRMTYSLWVSIAVQTRSLSELHHDCCYTFTDSRHPQMFVTFEMNSLSHPHLPPLNIFHVTFMPDVLHFAVK